MSNGNGPRSIFNTLPTVMIRAPLWPLRDHGFPSTNGKPRREVVQDKQVHEAVLAASPTLVNALIAQADGRAPTEPSPGATEALHRYLIRMSTRPTPFAAFAGFGMENVRPAEHNAVVLKSAPSHKPLLRLDSQFLYSIVQSIERDPKARHALSFYASSALFARGGRLYHPIVDLYGQGGEAKSASVRSTRMLNHLLRTARTAVLWKDLYSTLKEWAPQTPEKVIADYLDDLWRQGILLSSLRPPLTSGDPVDWVLSQLRSTPYRGEYYQLLTTLREEAKSYNNKRLGEGGPHLAKIYELTNYAEGARQATIDICTPLRLRQVQLSNSVLSEVAHAAHVLCRTSVAEPSSQALKEYRAAFLEKYGEREVPLMELLDPEWGLGPPAGYRNPPPKKRWAAPSSRPHSTREATLLQLAGGALRSGQREVVLDESLLSQLERSDWQATAPQSLDLFAFVAAKDAESIDAGDFSVVIGPRVGASPAGRSFGRFCHVAPDRFTRWLRARAEAEEERNPDILFADLLYSHPKGHATNVAIRPAIYRHQVTVNTTPSVAHSHVIPVDDVLVTASAGGFSLRSKTHHKTVVVRSMHLLNFMEAPNVCRFLQEVSDEGISPLPPFDWGPATKLPFLPRVRCGRTVLSLARWRLPRTLWNDPRDEEWLQAFKRWRSHWGLPRYAFLTEGDNRLLLDVEDSDHLALLQSSLAKLPTDNHVLTLEEALPGPEEAWVHDEQDRPHVAEFVFTLERNGEVRVGPEGKNSRESLEAVSRRGNHPRPTVELTDRIKAVGDEWLFFKLYTPASHHDDLMALIWEALSPALAASDAWFFLRYADPDPHLRLRLRGRENWLLGEALKMFIAHLNGAVEQGILQKYSLDTYEREIERYGGYAGMIASERLFHLDSVFVLDLLSLVRDQRAEFDRLSLTVASVDYLLRSLHIDIDGRRQLYRRLRNGQQAMQRLDEGALAQEYRAARPRLWSALASTGSSNHNCFRRFSSAVEPVYQKFRVLRDNNELMQPLERILSSHVHMHCNRMGLHRRDEFAAMYYLSRLYDGFRHYIPVGVQI